MKTYSLSFSFPLTTPEAVRSAVEFKARLYREQTMWGRVVCKDAMGVDLDPEEQAWLDAQSASVGLRGD